MVGIVACCPESPPCQLSQLLHSGYPSDVATMLDAIIIVRDVIAVAIVAQVLYCTALDATSELSPLIHF